MQTKIFIYKYLIIIHFILINTSCIWSQQRFSEYCLTNHPANDRYASYSPQGDKIVFESDRNGNWDIFIMDSDGNNIESIIQTPANERNPSWHPQGTSILYESDQNGKNELYEIILSTRQIRNVISNDLGNITFARYAPKGDRIAFSVQESESIFNIYIYNILNNNTQALTTGHFRNIYPTWSNNGKEILLFSRRDTNNEEDELYRLKIKTKKWRRLTHRPLNDFCPMWSHRGDRIAYAASMENTRPEIYIVRKNGKKPQRITWNDDGETLPTWSPDDKKLLITASRNGNYEICVIILQE